MSSAKVSALLALTVLPIIFDMGCAEPLTEAKLACWLLAAALAGLTPGRRWSKQEFLLLAWFGWACISAVFNGPTNAWIDLLTVGAGILWLRCYIPIRQSTAAAGFALTVLYAWIQRLGIDPFSWSDPVLSQQRTIAGFGNPNYLSMYLACLFPWVWEQLYRRGIIGWVAGSLSLLALLLTATRGSIISLLGILALATAWSIVTQRRLKKFWIVSWLLLALNWAIGWQLTAYQRFSFSGQMQALSQGRDESVTARLLLWGSAWQASLRSPLLGVGPGNFGDAYLQHRPWEPENLRRLPRRPENPHSEPLKVLSETGWIGLLLWGSWIGLGLRARLRHLQSQTACLLVLLVNCLSNCLTLPLWPLLLLWTLPETTDKLGPYKPSRLFWLPLSLIISLPGWIVQHVFWWDDEYKIQAQIEPAKATALAELRVKILQQAHDYCPPWEQAAMAIHQVSAWQNLAQLTKSALAWKNAELAARQRIVLQPGNAYSWSAVASVLENQGHYLEAIPFWQEAHQRDPLNPGTLFFLARAQYQARQITAALTNLDRSIEIYSKSSQVYRFRAQIMIDQGKVWEGYWDWVHSEQIQDGQ